MEVEKATDAPAPRTEALNMSAFSPHPYTPGPEHCSGPASLPPTLQPHCPAFLGLLPSLCPLLPKPPGSRAAEVLLEPPPPPLPRPQQHTHPRAISPDSPRPYHSRPGLSFLLPSLLQALPGRPGFVNKAIQNLLLHLPKLHLHPSPSSLGASLWDTWPRTELPLPLSFWEVSADVCSLKRTALPALTSP